MFNIIVTTKYYLLSNFGHIKRRKPCKMIKILLQTENFV